MAGHLATQRPMTRMGGTKPRRLMSNSWESTLWMAAIFAASREPPAYFMPKTTATTQTMR